MYLMTPYDNALQEILDNGVSRTNKRTGIKTISIFGMMNRYRLDTEFFPILTRRKVWPKSVFSELIWFLSGSTSNKDLKELGCNFWTPWVDHEWEKKYGYAEDTFGPVYGFQLRHFGGYYGNGLKNQSTQGEGVCSEFEWDSSSNEYGKGGFDQLAWVVNRIKEDPSCRRTLWTLWNPQDVSKMRLPPCFIAGSMVLTEGGYKPIENIVEGEIVCTDKGTGRVDKIFKTQYSGDVITIKPWYMSGVKITCTPNHPFLVKDKGFVEAGKLTCEDYVAVRVSTNEEYPEFKECIYVNQYTPRIDYKIENLDDWFMIGYFLGDGWCGKNDERVSFAINKKQVDILLPQLRKSIKICKKPGGTESCSTYETKSVKWHKILSTLGHKAHNKNIPGWILNAPKQCLESLVKGYLSADGHKMKTHDSFNTTSISLALGMQLIFAKLGKNAKIQFCPRPEKCIIEGREVNQRSFYTGSVIQRPSFMNDGCGKKYIPEEGVVWIKIKEITKDRFDGFVYNLSVPGDRTYTVNNLINHNCHMMFQVLVDDERRLTGILYQRSCDFPIGVPANIQFYSALTVMLAQQTDCTPHEFVHVTADSHIYEDQIQGVKEYLKTPIIDSPKLTIKKASDIFSYMPEDFTISEFKSGPKIEIPVAV